MVFNKKLIKHVNLTASLGKQLEMLEYLENIGFHTDAPIVKIKRPRGYIFRLFIYENHWELWENAESMPLKIILHQDDDFKPRRRRPS